MALVPPICGRRVHKTTCVRDINTIQYKHEVNDYLTFFVSVVLLFNFLVINITKCYDLQLREKEVLYHQLEIETRSCLLT